MPDTPDPLGALRQCRDDMRSWDDDVAISRGIPYAVVQKWAESLTSSVAALEKREAQVKEALKRRIPEKERGPWHHGYGCPAEIADTDNAPCTCGAWAQIDADRALVAEKDPEERPPGGETT